MTLLEFFRNEKSNVHGVKFFDILNYDDELFEKKHNFIQWLFPTDTKSKWNWHSPILTIADVAELNKDSLALEHIHFGANRFMHFLWYDIVGTNVVKSDKHDERTKTWITKNNHNYKRISRFLRFAKMMGGDMYQIGQHFLLSQLVQLWQEHKEEIGDNTLLHWAQSIGIDIDSIKK